MHRAILVLVFLLAASSQLPAQEFSVDARLYVSDLNIISKHIAKSELLNGDVAISAGASCSTMRSARRDRLGQILPSFFKERFEGPGSLRGISPADFLSYEYSVLKEFRATSETLKYLDFVMGPEPQISQAFPESTVALNSSISVLEKHACDLREQVSANLSGPAPPAEASIAKLLAKGALGLTVMVADAAAVVYAPYIAVTVISIASGGWGWNRLEEVYFEFEKRK